MTPLARKKLDEVVLQVRICKITFACQSEYQLPSERVLCPMFSTFKLEAVVVKCGSSVESLASMHLLALHTRE